MAGPSTASDPADSNLGAAVRRSWPLLLSIGLMMAGGGLQGALLGVRAEDASFDSTVLGVILGLYYLGYVAGSVLVPAMVRAVGHIRVFASLASMASATVVIHGVWVSPVPWMVLRFLTGLCVAGLFLVSESWLNDVSTARTRGTVLALYNTVVTAGLAVGSVLLNVADTAGFVLFVLGSVLLSLAAVPVALAPVDAPPPRPHTPRTLIEVLRSAPLGLAGSTVSGFGTGASLGFGAVYATRAGFGVSGASQFLVAVLAGAVVGQVPLGRWSDRTDRRRVMGAAAVIGTAGSAVGVFATMEDAFVLALVAGFAVGAGAFSLYGLSFAHVADYVDPDRMPATGARIVLVNGLGAASGPILASIALDVAGPEGLFLILGAVFTAFFLLVLVRVQVRAAVSVRRRSHYTPVATSATIGVVDETVAEVIHGD